MIIIKILFWNLAKNRIEKYLIDILDENDIDIAISAEYSGINFDQIINNSNNSYKIHDGMCGCDKITLLAKSDCIIEVKREHSRYTIYSAKVNNEKYIISGIHLQDNLHSDSDVRKITIRELVNDIREQESLLKNDNTIIIGDFNSSPFDDELVQKDAFNAVLFKDIIMKSEYVTFNGRKYRRFYNPMLNYISEDNSTYGSLYYSNGLKTLYWYFYDQILVRKSLVNRISNIAVCKAIKNKRLIKEVSPNKDISDHLPLIVEFERRIINE